MFSGLFNLISWLINLSLIMIPKNKNKLYEVNHLDKNIILYKKKNNK